MPRYAAAHESPQGPSDARPTALRVIEDEGLVGKLTDKVFFITGVSAGIGIETMRALYATGGHVFGTVRDLEKGHKVVDEIKAKTEGGDITLVEMEMDSLESVKEGVEEFLKKSDTLNVLICNAGVMGTPEGKTKDGFETQFGINHLGHFYLFQVLKPTLLASATADYPSRVVSVSSTGHRNGQLRTQDYNFTEPNSYDPWKAYGQCKLANIYFANELDRRYSSLNLHATSLHPGGVSTGLTKYVPPQVMKMWDTPTVKAYFKSPEQGAATSVYAAVSEEWKGKGGKFLANLVEQGPFSQGHNPMAMGDDGYAPHAYDEEAEARLWQDSLTMVGLEHQQ